MQNKIARRKCSKLISVQENENLLVSSQNSLGFFRGGMDKAAPQQIANVECQKYKKYIKPIKEN